MSEPLSVDFLSRFLADRWRRARLPTSHQGVPEARLSLGLRAKLAIDEAVLAFTLLGISFPTRSDIELSKIEISAAHDLFESSGWLQQPHSYHQTPPPLHRVARAQRQARGMRPLELSFASEYEPHAAEPGRDRWLSYGNNRTASAWVLQHNDHPRPWLVCIHGYGMTLSGMSLAAFRAHWLHEKLGVNLIFPLLPLHGARSIDGHSGVGFLAGNFLDTVHAEAQAMWDIRRLVAWIHTQGPTAVGVYGLSLGGYNAALLAAFEADLACVIAGIPATDFGRLTQEHAPADMLDYASQIGLDWSDVSDTLRVVSPLVLQPQVAHAHRYLFAGVADRFVPADHVRDLWEHWEKPQLHWYNGAHISSGWETGVGVFIERALRESGIISVA